MATVNTVLVEGIGAGAGPRNLLLFGYGATTSVPVFTSTINLAGKKSASVALAGNYHDDAITLDANKSSSIALAGDRR